MRAQAREMAAAAYETAVAGLFGLIENRIEWRRANAHLLALEAERMIYLLRTEPGRVAFRRLRIRIWKARYRKHQARAWAADAHLAHACLLDDCPGSSDVWGAD